jgi:hypothetical protein
MLRGAAAKRGRPAWQPDDKAPTVSLTITVDGMPIAKISLPRTTLAADAAACLFKNMLAMARRDYSDAVRELLHAYIDRPFTSDVWRGSTALQDTDALKVGDVIAVSFGKRVDQHITAACGRKTRPSFDAALQALHDTSSDMAASIRNAATSIGNQLEKAATLAPIVDTDPPHNAPGLIATITDVAKGWQALFNAHAELQTYCTDAEEHIRIERDRRARALAPALGDSGGRGLLALQPPLAPPPAPAAEEDLELEDLSALSP